jgi:hypothetical protein
MNTTKFDDFIEDLKKKRIHQDEVKRGWFSGLGITAKTERG